MSQQSMISKSRPQRKRKQSQLFSPMHPQEEHELMKALSISLRKLPEDGSVSEDDSEGTDDMQASSEAKTRRK